MINAAIAGMGWWGQTLVEGVSESDKIRFVAGVTRSSSDSARAFASAHGFPLRTSYEEVLSDPEVDGCVMLRPGSDAHRALLQGAATGGAENRSGRGPCRCE